MQGPLRKAVLGAVAATAIAGCGSDEGTIPQANADNLLDQLEAVESNIEDGDCAGAQAQADGFKTEVNLLPAEVDDEVKKGLQESANQLESLTSTECEEPDTGTTDIGGAVEPETTETTSTTTETTEATTEEEPEETAEPQTDEPQQDQNLAPEGSQGQGGGGSVGSDGGVSPSSGGVGSGGGG